MKFVQKDIWVDRVWIYELSSDIQRYARSLHSLLFLKFRRDKKKMGIIDRIFGFRKLKKSEEEFKEEIKKDPEDVIAHYNLGIVYSKIGRLDDAIEEYKLAIEYGSKYKADSGFLARMWFDLGVDYQQKEMLDKAITAYEKSLSYNPNYIKAKINLDQIKRLMHRR